jgi:nitroreductase
LETWEAIRSRRNVRSFTDQPIPGDHLDEILEAGRRSPSSQNWQPWDFVAVTERSRLVKLSSVAPGAGHVAGAAAAVAVCASAALPPDRQRTLYFDLGQATMSMLLAAAGLRIGGSHAGVADRELASSVLGLPADRFCAYIISLGYPADRPLSMIRRPSRRPLAEVVHREQWLRHGDDFRRGEVTVLDAQHADRPRGLPAPVRRRTGVEDPQAVAGRVKRDVRVPEHDQVRRGEPAAHPDQPVRGLPAVMHHGNAQAADVEFGRLRRTPRRDVGTVVVSGHGQHRRVLRQLIEHRGGTYVTRVQDQVRAAQVLRHARRAALPPPRCVRIRQHHNAHAVHDHEG